MNNLKPRLLLGNGINTKHGGKRKGYTPAEDQIIVSCVEKGTGNLTVAFEDAVKEIWKLLKIKRTPVAVARHWRVNLIPQLNNSGTPAFALGGKGGALMLNRKNVQRKKADDPLTIMDLLADYLPRMTKDQKKDLIKYIFENQ